MTASPFANTATEEYTQSEVIIKDSKEKKQTMELTLYRKWRKPTYSIGRLHINGNYFCDTCEDRHRNLYQGMGEKEILERKVYCETAIPYGRYRITMRRKSPKYSKKKAFEKIDGYMPCLLNVPGFSGILIHPGNWASDSCGCLLPGENKVKGGVVNSTVWFWKLYDILKAADERGEEIWITIQP
jgi:hypothetical protein